MKILSEGGVFREFTGIAVSEKNDIVELFFKNGEWLELTSDHQVYCQSGLKMARDIKVDDFVQSKDGFQEVIYKSKHNRTIKVFDIAHVEETHNFYANGILTHNCDEMAFVQNDVEFYTSTYPVISSGKNTKIIITSTPNGMNLFYKIFTDALNKRNNFIPIKYTWESHPDRDEEWKQETIRNTSLAQFRQEHECLFAGSSNTLISGEYLERMTYLNPCESSDYMNCYTKPIKDHIYIACVDVSEGIGRDYSTIQIIDITNKPYEQVFVYRRNDLSPWLLTSTVLPIAQQYNQAYILVENNSIGKIVADELFFEHEYENVISSRIKKGEEQYTEFSSQSFGILMTRKTKMLGCTALKTLIEEGFLKIVDFNTIQEISCFVKVRNSYEAEKGKHDDLVMPLVGFAWLTLQNLFEDLSVDGMNVLLKESRERESDNAMIFGFYDDGTDFVNQTQSKIVWNS